MSSVAPVPTLKPVLNQATIACKINGSRFFEGIHFTDITTPAPDLYSKPSDFTIRSDKPLGNPGQTMTITVNLSGFVRSFTFKDKETGQQKTGSKASVFLDLVN